MSLTHRTSITLVSAAIKNTYTRFLPIRDIRSSIYAVAPKEKIVLCNVVIQECRFSVDLGPSVLICYENKAQGRVSELPL